MVHISRLIALSLSLYLPVMLFGGFKGDLVPIEINVPQEELAKMDDEQRKVVETLMQSIKEKLTKWEDVDIQLPESQLSGVKVIDIHSLYRGPDTSELEQLAVDEEGNAKPLNDKQLEQLRQEGVFIVPSEKFPGKNHVWKVSVLVQNGRKNINMSFRKGMVAALDQIIIEIPERLKPDGFISVGSGAKNIYQGMRGILGSLVGLVEQNNKYTRTQIKQMVEKEKRKYVAEKIDRHNAESSENVVKFDLRLYDEKITKQVAGDVRRIDLVFQNRWFKESQKVKAEILAEIEKNGWTNVPDEEIDRRVEVRRVEAYRQALVNDERLEKKQPGYGQLLKNNDIAVKLAEDIEKKLVKMMRMQEEVIREHLRRDNPILSQVKPWLEYQVQKQVTDFYQEIHWKFMTYIPLYLEEWGLHQEAYTYWSILEFQKNLEEGYRKKIDVKEAAETFTFEEYIWNSQNWEITKPEGSNYYSVVKYKTKEVKTDQLFWRWRIVANDSSANFKNGLFNILFTNLYNGPVGIRSLVGNNPFIAANTFDATTGEIIPDPSSETHTLASRLRSIWNYVADQRQKFEDAPDTGMLSKSYTRWLNQFWNYGIQGVGGSVVLVVGQPVLTLFNVAFSVGATATAPVWAPMSSLFKMTYSATIYDHYYADTDDGENRRFAPILGYALSDIAVRGAGQIATAAVAATAIHPSIAALTATYTTVKNGVRRGWDEFMGQVLIKNARIPAENSWLVKRIKGPGLGSSYYFQIKPELAVLALLAQLESKELELFYANTREKINEPAKKYEKYFKSVLGSIGDVNPSSNPTTKKLYEEEWKNLEKLNDLTEERRLILQKISRLPYRVSRIRQSAEDLAITMNASHKLVKSFYKGHIETQLDEDGIVKFWNDYDLSREDFNGLTEKLLKKAFHRDFLEPLEVAEETLVIEVKDDDVKLHLSELFN